MARNRNPAYIARHNQKRNENLRRSDLIGRLTLWEEAGKRWEDMPAIRRPLAGAVQIFANHGITQSDYHLRHGRYIEESNLEMDEQPASSIPHASQVRSIERVQIVRDQFEDDLTERTQNFMRLHPDWTEQQARAKAKDVILKELEQPIKPGPMIDFNAMEKGK